MLVIESVTSRALPPMAIQNRGGDAVVTALMRGVKNRIEHSLSLLNYYVFDLKILITL